MLELLEAIPPAMGYVSIGVLIGIAISELHDRYFERRVRDRRRNAIITTLISDRRHTRSTDQ